MCFCTMESCCFWFTGACAQIRLYLGERGSCCSAADSQWLRASFCVVKLLLVGMFHLCQWFVGFDQMRDPPMAGDCCQVSADPTRSSDAGGATTEVMQEWSARHEMPAVMGTLLPHCSRMFMREGSQRALLNSLCHTIPGAF